MALKKGRHSRLLLGNSRFAKKLILLKAFEKELDLLNHEITSGFQAIKNTRPN
jgi:hypothetical protein